MVGSLCGHILHPTGKRSGLNTLGWMKPEHERILIGYSSAYVEDMIHDKLCCEEGKKFVCPKKKPYSSYHASKEYGFLRGTQMVDGYIKKKKTTNIFIISQLYGYLYIWPDPPISGKLQKMPLFPAFPSSLPSFRQLGPCPAPLCRGSFSYCSSRQTCCEGRPLFVSVFLPSGCLTLW